jgi:hypothetical protein
MALYPGGSIRSPEWLAIREQVRERAGDKCEKCGIANHVYVWRWPEGAVVYAAGPDVLSIDGRKPILIVCTVAHFDGKLVDHSLANLRFWCQRCHNRHDAPMRAAGRKARRDA